MIVLLLWITTVFSAIYLNIITIYMSYNLACICYIIAVIVDMFIYIREGTGRRNQSDGTRSRLLLII